MHSLLISSSELEAMEKSSIAMAASLEYPVSAAMARSYGLGRPRKRTRDTGKRQVCGACDGRRAAVRTL